MSVEELRSIGLNMGNAKSMRLAPPLLSPPRHLRCIRTAQPSLPPLPLPLPPVLHPHVTASRAL